MPLYDPNLGLITGIQRSTKNRAAGTQCSVYFKGCPFGCLWCAHPELIRPTPDLLFFSEKCNQCGSCLGVCPQNALSFEENGALLVDRSKCNTCAECVAACPQHALEISGRYITVGELAAELKKAFNGRQSACDCVIFNGGEPLWQAGFTAQVAQKIKEQGLRTVLETSGEAGWCRFEEVLPYIDQFVYEIKAADYSLHCQLTGRGNDLVLANARLLAERGIPMHIRMSFVPGLNDSPQEIRDRIRIVAELKSVQQIILTPYHHTGMPNYAQLGLEHPLDNIVEYDQQHIQLILKTVENAIQCPVICESPQSPD
jgi:pyruvate formate lyase activating enzyme